MTEAARLIGRPLRRQEDPRLLRGQGAYVAALALPGVIAIIGGRASSWDCVARHRGLLSLRVYDPPVEMVLECGSKRAFARSILKPSYRVSSC